MSLRVRESAFGLALWMATMLLAAPGYADSLYKSVAEPVPARPLDLFSDHRARNVGDLVTVVFDFAVSNSATLDNSSKKDFSANAGPGSGLLGFGPLHLATSLGGGSSADNTQQRSGQQSLNAVMEATVVGVLPNGNLEIRGHQGVMVNGQRQTLTITGIVRPEDIDSSNSVPSSEVADVSAKFDGQFQEPRRGLISKLLHYLF